MPAKPDPARIQLREFHDRVRRDMIPLNAKFSYFTTASPFGPEDLREYLEDPIAALPPTVLALLPKISILLVPYIEQANGKPASESADFVCFEAPKESKSVTSAAWAEKGESILVFAIDDSEVADYHYDFYRQLAVSVAAATAPDVLAPYSALVSEELSTRTHGEVDEASWQAKQVLLRRNSPARRDSKSFREYLRESFIDTLTLYLHGICCDIDYETGPRQLPSRHLRRRLRAIESIFPPPKGFAVFPEDADRA
jgi:hypothetical protein